MSRELKSVSASVNISASGSANDPRDTIDLPVRYSSLMTTPHRLFVFPRLSRLGIHGMKLEDG